MDILTAVGAILLAARWARTAEKSSNSSTELARAEWLGHVVVSAYVQAHDLFCFLCLGRQQNDGALQIAVPQLPADLKTVLTRKHHVERIRSKGSESAPKQLSRRLQRP